MSDQEAAIYRGDRTFSLERRPVPEPGAGEVAIDTAYCGICGTDLHVYLGHMDQRIGFDRVLGHETSGTVGAVGAGVSGLSVGERVVVRPLHPCGDCSACERHHAHICEKLVFIGLDSNGAMQRRFVVPASTVHTIPDDLPLKAAALVEPLAVAVHDVNRAKLRPKEDVLVIGGGPIGLLIALTARIAGANVMVSEINPGRLKMLGELGFRTFDPRDGDVAGAVEGATGGKGADVVFEVSGSKPGVALMTAAAGVRARIVMVAIHAQKQEVDLFRFFWRELHLIGARVYEPADYDEAIRLLAEGKIDPDVMITEVRPLADIGDAFQELADGKDAMKVLLKIGETA